MNQHAIVLKKARVLEPILSNDTLVCRYEIDGETFTNVYEFPEGMNLQRLTSETAQKLSQWMAIASSFGLFSLGYLTEIECEFRLTKYDVAFFEKIFYLGFGEFKLTNSIPLNTTTTLISSYEIDTTDRSDVRTSALPNTGKSLLLNGGGKDGSVSASLLSLNGIDFTWFQRGNSVAQQQVSNAWDKPVLEVRRVLDPNRKAGIYAGHRPMSAGIAFLSMLTAYLFDYSHVIASNEASANEGNTTIDGFTVNHQYSKSLEFETDLQNLFLTAGIHEIGYFSLLRPLSELQIASFTKNLSQNQLSAIVSCNNGTSTGVWCLACPKCAFIALVIYATDPNVARGIWGDVNVINTPSLAPYIEELLDPSQEKPLECVGTLDECHIAAGLILQHDASQAFLGNETKEMLQRFIPKDLEARMPATLEPHKIPGAFQPVLNFVQQSLSGAV